MLTPDLHNYLRRISAASPGIEEIWLIGSRANATATDESDWDFMAFGSDAVLEQLRRRPELSRGDVDLLVVGGDGSLRDPSKKKSGSLTRWQWTRESESLATYSGSKWIPDPEAAEDGFDTIGHLETRSLRAVKLNLPNGG